MIKNQFITKGTNIAIKAGNFLLKGFRRHHHVNLKGEIDLVTEMDTGSEKIITEMLRENFPYHTIIAEEGTHRESDSEYVWYIDPLDGTSNYAHGIPWFAVSLGLFRNGKPCAGIVYNPVNGELFHAMAGEGAFLNGIPIRVTERNRLIECILATGFPYTVKESHEEVTGILNRFLPLTRGIRRFGSAALDLAYTACGVYDGYWEQGLKPWDTSAGILLVIESGGKISDYSGGEFHVTGNTLVADNGKIHEPMIRIIGGDTIEM